MGTSLKWKEKNVGAGLRTYSYIGEMPEREDTYVTISMRTAFTSQALNQNGEQRTSNGPRAPGTIESLHL